MSEKLHFRISASGPNGIEDWTEAFADEAAARAALSERGFEPRLLEPLPHDPFAVVPIRPPSAAERELREARDAAEREEAERRRRRRDDGLDLGNMLDD